MTLACQEPEKWIANNLLSSAIAGKIGKKVIGGAGAISILAEPKTWNVKFEPGENAINVDFNATQETKQLPDEKRLREELREQFDALMTILKSLGLS